MARPGRRRGGAAARHQGRRHAARRSRRRRMPDRTLRVALQVTLPEGYHVQSNKPRDPSLIPTVLTVDAPAGVTVAEVVFPAPVDTKLVGVDQPLAVFERKFAIGVRLSVANTVAPGEIDVPARLRYQACNDTTCFAPTTADGRVDAATSWPRTRPSRRAPRRVRHDRVRPRRSAPPASPRRCRAAAAAANRNCRRRDLARLDGFAVLGTTGGYLGSERLPRVHPQRRERRAGARAVRRTADRSRSCCSCSSAASR